MIKKLLLILLIGSIGLAYANNASGVSATTKNKTTSTKPLNSPNVGSRQYSNGNFGSPKITGKSGQVYYTDKELSNSSTNQAQVTGSNSYSSRATAKTKLSGKKDSEYYTENELSNGLNQSTQGSRIGSNQVFNYPGVKTDKNNSSSSQ